MDGTYDLEVPVPRDAKGVPVATKAFTLADAQDYQTFPGGLRTALRSAPARRRSATSST